MQPDTVEDFMGVQNATALNVLTAARQDPGQIGSYLTEFTNVPNNRKEICKFIYVNVSCACVGTCIIIIVVCRAVHWLNTNEDAAPYFYRHDQFLFAFKEPENVVRGEYDKDQFLVCTRKLRDGKSEKDSGVIYEPAMMHVQNEFTLAKRPTFNKDGYCVTVARVFIDGRFPRDELMELHPKYMCPSYMGMVYDQFPEFECTVETGWDATGGLPKAVWGYPIWELFLSDCGDVFYPQNSMHRMKRIAHIKGPSDSGACASDCTRTLISM